MTTNNSQNAQIPALGLFQFDANAVGAGVNLFRGNLAFPLNLISLPGRNGLIFSLSILYQSGVQRSVDSWNLSTQTDIAGLGWSLGYDRIVRDPSGTGSLVDATFYLISQGQTGRLVPIPTSWARATLPAGSAALLKSGAASSALLNACRQAGLPLSATVRLTPCTESGEWLLHDDGRERLYRLRAGSDGAVALSTGGQSYELATYQFWQISFYPDYNAWEIVKEDGSVCTYGGAGEAIQPGEEPNTVQWGIRWGNWIGPSMAAANQQRYAKAWNLARLENAVGNSIRFSYTAVEQKVGSGSLTYTKECHLLQVMNDLGWSCRFAYQPMIYQTVSLAAPKEYIDPHHDPATKPGTQPDGFQSEYITQYLDRITVTNSEQAEQVALQFHYCDEVQNLTTQSASNPLGYGGTYKRYLQAITQVYPSGASRPGVSFEYLFTTDPEQNRGALQKITYPTGGSTIFCYEKITVGANSESDDPGARNLMVPNPFGNTADSPRIWYGNDYVVCAWYSETQSALKLNLFTWVGRWHQWQSDWFTLNQSVNPDELQVATSEDVFVLAVPHLYGQQTDLYLFNRKHLCEANWEVQSAGGEPVVYTYSTTGLKIAGGLDFFLLTDPDNQLVDRYAWNWMSRGWEIAHLANVGQLCQRGTGYSYTYYVTAHRHYYLIHCYDQNQQISQFSLFYRDPLLNWCAGGTVQTDQIAIPGYGGFSYFAFGPSESFAAMAYITGYTPSGPSSFSAFQYSIKVLTWDDGYANLRFATLPNLGDDGFVNVPVAMLRSIGPTVVENAAIGSGPNLLCFDGAQWSYQFLGIQYRQFSDPSVQYYWYAYAANAALKTENTAAGIYSTLVSRDPNHPTAGWQTQVLTDLSPPPDTGRETLYYPTLAGGYLTQNASLYNRSVYTDWSDLSRFLLAQLNAQSLDSTTMINQAPHFTAFMTLDSHGDPQATSILFWRNGDLIRNQDGSPYVESFDGQAMFRFLDPYHRYATALSGKLPAIPFGFMTYAVSEDPDRATQITLHRYANDSVQGPIETFVVTGLITDTGYDRQERCYAYADISAAQDQTGTIVRFQTVTEYSGCLKPADQKNGWTQHHFYNGLPPESVGVRAFSVHDERHYSMLDGMLVRREVYDAAGNLVASTENAWMVVDQVATNPDGSGLRNLCGGIPQVAATTQMVDGVSRTTIYTYSPASGAPYQVEHSYWGSQGEQITVRESTLFAYERYPAMWERNLLQPVAQQSTWAKTETTDFALQSQRVNTCQAWTTDDERTYWAESASWIPLAADAPAFTWWNAGDPGSLWQCTERILMRGRYGEVLRSVDAQGRPASFLFDDAAIFPIARFVNATPEANGVCYESFESYQTNRWQWSGGSAGAGPIDADSFTGERCLAITQPGTLSRTVTLANVAGQYLFTLWLKAPPGADVTLAITAAGGQALTKPLSPTGMDWQYAQWVADLGDLGLQGGATLTLQIRVSLGSEQQVLIDDLFFTPLQSQFGATVLDISQLVQTATLGPNGTCQRSYRNRFYSPMGEATGEGWPTSITSSFLSLQTAPAFAPASPNLQVGIGGRQKGFSDQFKAGALDRYTCVASNPQDWRVAGRRLSLVTPSSDPLGARVRRNGFSASSLAIAVTVESAATNTVTLGTGSFYVRWTGSVWQLCQKIGTNLNVVQSNSAVGYQQEWLLTLFDNRLLFWAGGIQLFSHAAAAIAAQPHGVELGLQQPGAFYNLLVAQQVSLGLSYSDGVGRTLQSLAMESGESTILSAVLYDERGNKAITIKPSRVTAAQVGDPFCYLSGYVTNGAPGSPLWSGAPMTGPVVSTYHRDDGGYPFTRQVYEASPLGRVIAVGQPGLAFAITTAGNPHIQTTTYGHNSTTGPFAFPLPIGQYLVMRLTDQDGTVTETWSDTEQHQIGQTIQTTTGGPGPSSLCFSTVYDQFGRPTASIPPNCYPQATGTRQIPAEAVTATHNFLGQVVASQDPDQGMSRGLYNNGGQPRFMQDERGQAEGYINYLKYDALNRVLEEGHYATTWQPDLLQSQVNNADWPPAPTTWGVRRFYDGDDTTVNMVGRLWRSEANNAGSTTADVTDTFSYDRAGRTVRKERQSADFGGAPFALTYTYDLGGAITSATDDRTGLTATYTYNPLGQMREMDGTASGITTPLVGCTYTQEGQTESVALLPTAGSALLTRRYQYLPPGWPTAITDEALDEQLQYTSGGPNGAGYYTGVIAHQRLSYQQGQPVTEEQSIGVDYLGRIAEAQGGADLKWSIDGNGNILSQNVDHQSRTYTYAQPGSNRLLNISTAGVAQSRQYGYGYNGAVKSLQTESGSVLQFSYGKSGSKVTTITGAAAGDLAFQYAGDGSRTLKRVTATGGSTERYLRLTGLSIEPVLEAQGSGEAPKVQRYLSAPGFLVIYQNGQYRFGVRDHLGSVRLLLDQKGKVVGQFSYDLYGQPTIITQPDLPFWQLYTGQSYDAETGLYDFKARLYDPVAGRFLAVDPALQQPSPYAYVGGNPLNAIDPTGALGTGWLIGSIVAGLAVTLLTGGALGAVVGTGLVASMGVAAVAGAAGAMASHAFVAAGNHEAYFSQSLLFDVLAGAAGGLIGAGVGGAVGRGAMSVALSRGAGRGMVMAVGGISAGISGGVAGGIASSGVTALANHESFFSKSTALNIGIGALAGLGGGVLGSGVVRGFGRAGTTYKTMPLDVGSEDFASLQPDFVRSGGRRLLNLSDLGVAVKAISKYGQDFFSVRNGAGPRISTDVVKLHGSPSTIWPKTMAPNGTMYNRPMAPDVFGEYLRAQGFGGPGGAPIKLISCSAGGSRLFGLDNVAQTLANTLRVDVYAATRSISASYQGPWVRFQPS